MSSARSMLTFMQSGLHANRPATPSLLTGEIALYYETDTSHLFAYIQGTGWVQIDSAASNAPTIVQNSSVALSNHSVGITLSSAPVQGNMLVAFVSDQTGGSTAGAGWLILEDVAAANDDGCVLIKIAGASESATQTPVSDGHQGTITVYELTNAAGGLPTVVTQYTGSAVTENPNSTKATGNGLIIGAFVNRTTSGPTSITGTGVTADNTASGVGRFAAGFHISAAANGTNAVTANYATSQGGVFMALCVG